MKITGTSRKDVEVEVSDNEIMVHAISLVLRKLGFNRNHHVDDGYLFEWDDYCHGSYSRKMIREATKEDIKAFEAIDFLNRLWNGEK